MIGVIKNAHASFPALGEKARRRASEAKSEESFGKVPGKCEDSLRKVSGKSELRTASGKCQESLRKVWAKSQESLGEVLRKLRFLVT